MDGFRKQRNIDVTKNVTFIRRGDITTNPINWIVR